MLIKDLDDEFISTLLATLPAGPHDSFGSGNQAAVDGFIRETGLDAGVAEVILARFSAEISSLHEQSAQMLQAYKSELDACCNICTILVYAVESKFNPQKEFALKIASKLAERNFIGLLFSSMEHLAKASADPDFSSLHWKMAASLLQSKHFLKKGQVKVPYELLPSYGERGYFSSVSAWLWTVLFLKPADGLVTLPIKQLCAHFQNQPASVYAFASALAFYQHPESKGCHEIASKCAGSSDIWSQLMDCANNGVSLKALYSLYYLLFSLFDVSKFEKLTQFVHCLATVLKQDTSLVTDFLEDESYSKPLLQILMDRFPVDLMESTELFSSLSTTVQGAALVNSLLTRVPKIYSCDRPDLKCIQVSLDSPDMGFSVVYPLELNIHGVQLVIPEETQGTLAHILYQWFIPVSGWDLLARVLSANFKINPALAGSILRLFINTFGSMPSLAPDLDAFLKRINPIFLDSKGHSLVDRLFLGLTMSTDVRSLIIDCLSVFGLYTMDEQRIDDLIAYSNIVDSEISSAELSAEQTTVLDDFLKMVALTLPLLHDDSTANSLIKLSFEFTKRGLASIPTDALAQVLVNLYHIQSLCQSDTDSQIKSLLSLAPKVIKNSLNGIPSEQLFELLLELWHNGHEPALIEIFSSDNFNLDPWIMHALDTGISALFIETAAALLSCKAKGSMPVLTLLVNSLFAASRLGEACKLLFELAHGNFSMFKGLFAEADYSNKIQEQFELSELAFIEFLGLLRRSILQPNRFLEVLSVFPGSAKATWDLLVHATSKYSAFTLAPSLEMFSVILIGTQIKELEVPYLISKIDTLHGDRICEKLSQDIGLLETVCHFILVLLSRHKMDSFAEKLLKSMMNYVQEFDVVMLGALARTTFITKDIKNASFVAYVNHIAERFEALSAAELTLIAGQDDLELWSNFVLLNHQVTLTKPGLSGMLVILRFICSHVAINPDKHLSSTLLLFSGIISSPSLGQPCVQYLCFYHIIDDIFRSLLRSSNKQLLPVFLQCHIFAETFMDAGHFRGLIEGLCISPHDEGIWRALHILAANEPFKIPLTLQFPFDDFDLMNCEELSTLLAVLVPLNVDYFNVTTKSANLTLIQCAWNIVASKPISDGPLRNALVSLSLLMVPVFDVHSDLQELFVNLIQEFKPRLTEITTSGSTCAELALAILDLLS